METKIPADSKPREGCSVYAVSIYAKFRLRGIFGKVQKNSIYALLLVIPLFTRFYVGNVGKICAFKDVDL